MSAAGESARLRGSSRAGESLRRPTQPLVGGRTQSRFQHAPLTLRAHGSLAPLPSGPSWGVCGRLAAAAAFRLCLCDPWKVPRDQRSRESGLPPSLPSGGALLSRCSVWAASLLLPSCGVRSNRCGFHFNPLIPQPFGERNGVSLLLAPHFYPPCLSAFLCR